MKLLEQKNKVKIDGDLSTEKFTIQFNSKMASMLSDKLYSDKIAAVIRELSTNAADSHVEAGKKNIPFEVTLPTNWSPHFIIQDYGTGLSPENISNIYRVYGVSSRENSNETTGMLGLGSKVPFAYHTKTFNLESTVNGIKYSYSGYIGEENLPCLSKIGEITTNECNGVKITIPVNRNDVFNFTNKAKEIYEFFNPRPKIKGTSIQFDTPSLIVDGVNWHLRNYGSTAFAVMSNIKYPISFSDTSLSDLDRRMMQHPFYIFFETGDLDIEISREGLSYDVKTKTAILAKFREIRKQLADNFQKDIDKCTSLWEARLLAISKSGVLYEYMDRKSLVWSGKKLFDSQNSNEIGLGQKIGYYNSYYSAKKHCKIRETDSVPISKDILFLRNDLDKGLDTRVYHRYQTLGRIAIFVVKDDAEQKLLIDKLGIDASMFTLASSLPKPAPKVRVVGTGTKRGNTENIMEFNTGYYSNLSAYYTNVDKDLDDGGEYFEFNTFKCVWNGQNLNPKVVSEIIETVELAGGKKRTVYAIKTAKIPRLGKTKKMWTNYIDSALTELDKIYSSLQYTKLDKIKAAINKFGMYDYYSNTYFLSLDDVLAINKDVTQKDFNSFADLVTEVKKLNDVNSVRNGIENLYNTLGRTLPTAVGTPIDVSAKATQLETEYKALVKKYPLLKLANELSSKKDLFKDIAIYINAK